ncbi:TVP38/TMEM64 family protein [Verrucomicrobiota bacterium sgz303538]
MSRIKRVVYLQTLGLVAAAGFVFWLVRHYPVVEWVGSLQKRIAEMGVWGAALYPLLFAACNVLLLPGGVLAMGSGLFFGLWWGTALNIVGMVLGAAISFLISRKLGRSWLERKLRGHQKWVALDKAIAREGWKIIFLSQVHPLFPSSLLNYLYGITRIRFSTCLLWIALGQAPGMFLYAYFGTLAQLGLRLLRGQSHPLAHEYIIWIGGLVLTIIATTCLGRIALRLLAEAEAEVRQNRPPDSPELPQPPGGLEDAQMS